MKIPSATQRFVFCTILVTFLFVICKYKFEIYYSARARASVSYIMCCMNAVHYEKHCNTVVFNLSAGAELASGPST